jgi:ABC-type polysaccharide/polyol phosphate transport system ATPase subunit
VVLAQKVSKLYPLYRRPSDRLLEVFGGKRHTDFWALRDVSFTVERGETFGIVGPNGSGKSTLLEIVSGIVKPTSGRVIAGGRITALLELGAGFNPEFTGRENVFLNSEILGMSRRETAAVFPRIADFADIGEFMDRPVKEYSSGMYVRLAFAAAIHQEPDILIVDEALAVGDAIFANRCVRKFDELRERKVTILFVTHDLGLLKRLASRAILMWKGRIEKQGAASDVVNRYVGLVHERQREDAPRPEEGAGSRHGDRSSRIAGVRLLDAGGRESSMFRSGETMTVRVEAAFAADVAQPVVGILVRNRLGIDVFGTNTRIEGIELGEYRAGDRLEIEFRLPCLLTRQSYTLTAATQHWDGSSQDWLDDALAFEVHDSKDLAGMLHVTPRIEWRRSGGDSA